MIRHNGPGPWSNVHVTHRVQLADLLDVDNSGVPDPSPFDYLKQAARDVDQELRRARDQDLGVRALGSGWALTNIAVPDHWLINTKLLNGCFDVGDRFFDPAYPAAKRPLLVVAQCGMSVAELNAHLEVPKSGAPRRALKTAGIGAGQTIAGAVSGNTHGSAVNFGAMPDFVVGLQVVTGSGRSLWIERASEPVLNDQFTARLEADRIRDDEIFNAAVVSFGAFGVITALAIETDPIYHLDFAPVHDIALVDLKQKLDAFDPASPAGLHHYEFIIDPYSDGPAMEAVAIRLPYDAERPAPPPTWIVRDAKGFAMGLHTAVILSRLPVPGPAAKTAIQFKEYRKRCIIDNVRATPGQLFTASISYFEGFTESAIGVPITHASRMIDVSARVIRDQGLPAMAQVRVVHPTRATLGFTRLGPKTVVFEFGLVNDASFAAFENALLGALTAEGIRYTLHWSKNSGLDAARVAAMYGQDAIDRWRAARDRVFGGDATLKRVFSNEHLRRAGLA